MTSSQLQAAGRCVARRAEWAMECKLQVTSNEQQVAVAGFTLTIGGFSKTCGQSELPNVVDSSSGAFYTATHQPRL